STATTVTPFQFCPTFTVLGSPPSSASTAALSPITPISATSPGRAGVQARNSTSAIILGMRPVAIIRHSASEGPAYFATYLERRSIPWQLIALDAGEPVPRDVAGFSGLALMGGPMSANDPLPWVAPVLELIRDAVRRDVPAIGHCLGAQLMSKAFGGTVRASAVREIGWGEVRVADNAVARDWLGELQAFESFHWYGESVTDLRTSWIAACRSSFYALATRTASPWIEALSLSLESLTSFTMLFALSWAIPTRTVSARFSLSPEILSALPGSRQRTS